MLIISDVSDIAFCLNYLIQKGGPLSWTSVCETDILDTQEKLTRAPVLVYPKFGDDAGAFTLETDAFAIWTGVGWPPCMLLMVIGNCRRQSRITVSPSKRVWQLSLIFQKTIRSLSCWMVVRNSVRQCPSSVALRTEKGWTAVQVGLQFHYQIL